MLQMKNFWHDTVRAIKQSDYNTRALTILFILAVAISMVIRIRLIHIETSDFTDFLKPWMEHLHTYGLAGLGNIVTNYNVPYLVLLWAASHLPFAEVVSVKLISITFDIVLAIGAMLVVGHFMPRSRMKYLTFLAILFAPTVIQNGAMWGQCDVIYTSFAVYAFYACLKNKNVAAWVLWGIAFAFKLQAIFFLPFLLFFMFYKRRTFYGPLVAAGIWMILSALPLFFGKTPMDIINVYIGQTAPPIDHTTSTSVEVLSWFAPTAYQWVSNTNFWDMRAAGILLGGTTALVGISLAFVRKYTERTILVIATTILIAVPFFMPQIHERYMFTAEIFMIITACVIPKFIWAAIAMQIVTTMAYITYFTGADKMPPIPFAMLSLVVFAIIFAYGRYIYTTALSISSKKAV